MFLIYMKRVVGHISQVTWQQRQVLKCCKRTFGDKVVFYTKKESG